MTTSPTNALAYTVTDGAGDDHVLAHLAGRLTLIVNVASKCGLTPQYEGLQALYDDLHDDGLQIIGFPCNQFGGQEPGTQDEIEEFCTLNYSVTFPIMAKIEVNGPGAHPLYEHLRAAQRGTLGPDTPGAGPLLDHLRSTAPEVIGTDAVKWNFTKFLVDDAGAVLQRYEPTVAPVAIRDDLVTMLGVTSAGER